MRHLAGFAIGLPARVLTGAAAALIRQYAADLASLAAVNPAWYDAVGGGGMLAVVIFLTLLAALFGLVPPPPATLPSSPRHRPPTTAALPWLRRPRQPPGGHRR